MGYHEQLYRHRSLTDHQPRGCGTRIAEALLATALGLVAAIPAVVIYNIFARMISAYRGDLGDTAAHTILWLGRDLDLADSKAG